METIREMKRETNERLTRARLYLFWGAAGPCEVNLIVRVDGEEKERG